MSSADRITFLIAGLYLVLGGLALVYDLRHWPTRALTFCYRHFGSWWPGSERSYVLFGRYGGWVAFVGGAVFLLFAATGWQ